MSYFDFHIHQFGKHFLTGAEKAARVSLQREVGVCAKLPELDFIVPSQSAPFQTKIPGAILCSAFVPLERGISRQGLIRNAAPRLTRLDRAFVNAIANGRISYWRLLNEEMDYGLEALAQHFPEFQLLNEKRPVPQPGKTGVVFAVEGGHAFMDDTATPAENLKKLRRKASDKGFTLLYCNLTHLTRIEESNHQKELSNFSYGMKMIADAAFHPRGKGISDEGWRFIREAWSRKEGFLPVLIDVKHMSLYSRKQFYAFRKKNAKLVKLSGPHFSQVPVISSHSGITGLSWKKFADEVVSADKGDGTVALRIARPRAGDHGRRAWFNPWTINLFDEDIREIVASGGLIGISLDQRVLGFDPLVGKLKNGSLHLYGEEYMSTEEFEDLGISLDELADKLASFVEKAAAPVADTREFLGLGEQELNKKLHTFYFCYNVLHVLNVGFTYYAKEKGMAAKEAMDNAWQHVCIGSDFDGLIDPVNSFRDCTEWEEFEKRLNRLMGEACTHYLEERKGLSLPIEGRKGLQRYLRGLLFENGRNFIQRWLTNQS